MMPQESMQSRLTRFCPPGQPPNQHLHDLAKRLDALRTEQGYLEVLFIEQLILDLTEVQPLQVAA